MGKERLDFAPAPVVWLFFVAALKQMQTVETQNISAAKHSAGSQTEEENLFLFRIALLLYHTKEFIVKITLFLSKNRPFCKKLLFFSRVFTSLIYRMREVKKIYEKTVDK